MINHLSSPKTRRSYHSYLLRLWQDDHQTPWRILVQSVQSGETIHFVDLESFFVFLQAQTASEQSAVTQGPFAIDDKTVSQ